MKGEMRQHHQLAMGEGIKSGKSGTGDTRDPYAEGGWAGGEDHIHETEPSKDAGHHHGEHGHHHMHHHHPKDQRGGHTHMHEHHPEESHYGHGSHPHHGKSKNY